mmetsp:Transcript_10957/g.23007  ORF Transcript_10957/g.23007 Transcript_10957/m.23007 type:complete len:256 (+) Transcript_10957:702-1469(+)
MTLSTTRTHSVGTLQRSRHRCGHQRSCLVTHQSQKWSSCRRPVPVLMPPPMWSPPSQQSRLCPQACLLRALQTLGRRLSSHWSIQACLPKRRCWHRRSQWCPRRSTLLNTRRSEHRSMHLGSPREHRHRSTCPHSAPHSNSSRRAPVQLRWPPRWRHQVLSCRRRSVRHHCLRLHRCSRHLSISPYSHQPCLADRHRRISLPCSHLPSHSSLHSRSKVQRRRASCSSSQSSSARRHLWRRRSRRSRPTQHLQARG